MSQVNQSKPVKAKGGGVAYEQPDGSVWKQAPDGSWVIAEKKKRRKWPWVLGSLGAIVVLIVVVFSLAVNNAVNQLNAEQQKHAITQSQFNSVQLGISQTALSNSLGKTPESSQEFVSKGVLSQQQIKSSCVYYNEAGHVFGRYYQFCFDNGALTSKNQY